MLLKAGFVLLMAGESMVLRQRVAIGGLILNLVYVFLGIKKAGL